MCIESVRAIESRIIESVKVDEPIKGTGIPCTRGVEFTGHFLCGIITEADQGDICTKLYTF